MLTGCKRNDCAPDLNSSCSYLGLEVSHGLLEGLWRCPLVVTENSNCSVSPVVGQQLLCLVVRLLGGWQNRNLYLWRNTPLRTISDQNYTQKFRR